MLYILGVLLLLAWAPPELEVWFRPRSHKPFSEAAWHSTRSGEPDRYKMANDLLRSKLLLGKTEREVRNLLGSPTSQDPDGADMVIGYDLISQRRFPSGCALLPSSLFLNTDTWLLELQCERGRVIAVRIRST
jgi:hypothetical protein